jgi:GNAT superfamily N-acetyltransferase
MNRMKLVPAERDVLERILDQTHAIWSDRLSRPAYARYNAAQLLTPWGARHLRRYALLDHRGRILSSAKRYQLLVSLDGREMSAVGLGAVFTPVDMRGRGYARAIVERLVDDAARSGAELALLFSEIDPGFYTSMGFAPVPRHEHLLRTCGPPGAPMTLVRAGEERDIPAVAALARTMAMPHRFALVPTKDSIRFSLSKKRLLAGFLPPESLSVEFFVVEEGASAVAFAILTTTKDDSVLEMCGDRDPSGARVGALLQVLNARTPAEARPKVAAFLPPRWLPPQLEIERSALVREVLMIRPLAPRLLDRPLVEDDVLFWHGDLM